MVDSVIFSDFAVSNHKPLNIIAMLPEAKIKEIFFALDEFSQEFNATIQASLLSDTKSHRKKSSKLSESEVSTILVLFHLGGFRCLKHFYLEYICKHMRHDFPTVVSYNCFVELQEKISIMLVCFLKMCRLGECTGVSFVDSTHISVCDNKRISQYKVFNGIA